MVEIDLDALCANFRTLARAAPGAEAAAVVKCDAYGLGAAPVAAALAEEAGCRTFFVAYVEEGAALRRELDRLGHDPSIYVFNGPRTENAADFVRHRLKPVLNDLAQARLWAELASGAPACLHIDTGMNRLGAAHAELSEIARLPGLALDLVMSHLACSPEPHSAKNEAQLDAFNNASALFAGVRRSFAASAGALLPQGFHFDVTRLGIGVYGANPLDAPPGPPLQPVARLTAPVAQLRDAAAGESVGYGATHVFEEARRLAVVQLGYGDGFPRIGGNRARAWLAGAECPVVGRVSMDYIALDVTEAPEPVRPGDRAEFFGPKIPIEEAAAACATVPYEMLTGLGPRVHRRYLSKRRRGTMAAPGVAGEPHS